MPHTRREAGIQRHGWLAPTIHGVWIPAIHAGMTALITEVWIHLRHVGNQANLWICCVELNLVFPLKAYSSENSIVFSKNLPEI